MGIHKIKRDVLVGDIKSAKIMGIRLCFILGGWIEMKQKDFDNFIKEFKKKWRIKARRMEIMSGEVAIYEVENLLNDELGEKFKDEK